MSVNPYAPPRAYVADRLAPDDVGTAPPFFAVSVTKLVVMSLCTLGVYEIYWFYRQWRRIAERQQEGMAPLARAIFAIFYCYSCFKHIRDYDAETRTSAGLRAGPLAIGWIVTTMLWRLPDPYGWISMFAFVFLIPVQTYVNRLNAASSPSHDRNAGFSMWNWLAVILGGLVGMLVLAETLLRMAE